jgi:hypothetical protein
MNIFVCGQCLSRQDISPEFQERVLALLAKVQNGADENGAFVDDPKCYFETAVGILVGNKIAWSSLDGQPHTFESTEINVSDAWLKLFADAALHNIPGLASTIISKVLTAVSVFV